MTARQNAQLRSRYQQALREAGISEVKLAEELGIARNTLSKIGVTKSGPHLATLLLVAERLKVYSVDALLGPSGTQDMVLKRSEVTRAE